MAHILNTSSKFHRETWISCRVLYCTTSTASTAYRLPHTVPKVTRCRTNTEFWIGILVASENLIACKFPSAALFASLPVLFLQLHFHVVCAMHFRKMNALERHSINTEAFAFIVHLLWKWICNSFGSFSLLIHFHCFEHWRLTSSGFLWYRCRLACNLTRRRNLMCKIFLGYLLPVAKVLAAKKTCSESENCNWPQQCINAE